MIYTFHWHSIVNSHGSLNKHKGIGGIYDFEFDNWLRQRNIPEDDTVLYFRLLSQLVQNKCIRAD